MVSPASKFKDYEPLFNVLFESFVDSLKIKPDARGATPRQRSTIPAADEPVTTAFHFKFTNNCQRPIKLAILYRNLQGGWKDVGLLEFAPRETALLNTSNALLTTSTAVWYYYAVTTDGSVHWSGKETYEVKGQTLPMRKIEMEGEKEWSISCNAQK
jgi:hypothetical protein